MANLVTFIVFLASMTMRESVMKGRFLSKKKLVTDKEKEEHIATLVLRISILVTMIKQKNVFSKHLPSL